MSKRSSQTRINDLSGLLTRPRRCKTYRWLAFYIQELQCADWDRRPRKMLAHELFVQNGASKDHRTS
jgi:hypothetical protein